MEREDYVSIPLDDMGSDKFCQLADSNVIEHILAKISLVYPHITHNYISGHFYALKDKLGMYYPKDYIEELYSNFQTSADTGYYYYGHYLPDSASVYRSTEEPGTFLVNREIDFIFTYMIDIITIVQHYSTEGEIAYAIELADNRYNERLKLHKLCCDSDCIKGLCISMSENDIPLTRLCSICWVLYTRTDSNFYQNCMTIIQANKHINFTSSAYESLEIEHRLFSHVLFLCGKSILPESRDNNEAYAFYTGINKWVVLPIWFHLLLQVNKTTTTQK